MKKMVIHPDFEAYGNELNRFIDNFDTLGQAFGNQDRNSLKLFQLGDKTLNIKSFRIPNFINQLAYRFLRKSKAQRSFEYAKKLQSLGVGTPEPIAYCEFKSALLFKKSFYISDQLEYDLTYRELTTNLKYPNHESILRAFTRFTYRLHENNINFLDHSPGNTLIKKNGNGYDFFLVDLNRMEFGAMDFETRIRNFAKLTVHKTMVETMSDEYAKCSNKSYDLIFDLMWNYTQAFQEKYRRKRKFKKNLKFWKKS